MKTKVLCLVHSFPENLVTFSKFRGFADHPKYDYRVFCWESGSAAWQALAPHAHPNWRRQILLSGTSQCWKLGLAFELLALAWTILCCPFLVFRHVRQQLSAGGLRPALYRLLEDHRILRFKPDILHFEYGTLAISKLYLKALLGCKAVSSFRGFDLNYYQLGNDAVYAPVWEGLDGFHFLGKDLLARARRRGFRDHKLTALIPPAVDLDSFSTAERAPKAPGSALKIVSVGRLVWKKGFHHGLLAFADFLKKGGTGTYDIVGDGPTMEELKYYRQELGLNEHVRLLGQYTPQQVRGILSGADIFLHPAVSEGFCNAVLEAQAMQLPVVCFAADGLSENVAQGKTGWIAPLFDREKLSDDLYTLWKDPEMRENMGRNGRKRVAELFNIRAQITAFDTFYKQVVASSNNIE